MISICTAILFCMVIPFLIMVMLAPSLEACAPHVDNYRGVSIYNGLGIVWFVWLVFFWVGAHLLSVLGFQQPSWVSYLIRLFPLIAGACAFGLFDDWVGDRTSKGFRGHLHALRRGILTTGGLKLVGIGFLALFTAVSLYWSGIDSLPRIILATCVIALSANLMNLFDLRPGRAGKMYILGLIVAFIALSFSPIIHLGIIDSIALAFAVLGPLIAVWRFDVGEKGMLGDAGANSMGALLGYLLATALPTWALLICTIALFAVNLLSERISFSAIIAGNKVLSIIDDWGRPEGSAVFVADTSEVSIDEESENDAQSPREL